MNKLKTLFSSLLLLFVVCQSGSAEAMVEEGTHLPLYQNTIANISLGYDEAMLTGSIKLDNGLALRIVDYKTRDDNVMKTWSPGDVITFDAQVKDDALILTAKRVNDIKNEVEALVILDVTKEEKNALSIVQINKNGKFIKLSDGSVWEFSYYNQFSTKKWKTEEHVIVQGKGDINCYNFINIDCPVQDNVQSAKASFVIN